MQLKKPELALAIATALGVGYIPKVPGTFGSLVGLGVVLLTTSGWVALALLDAGIEELRFLGREVPTIVLFSTVVFLVVAFIGVWSGSHVAAYAGVRDPQYVVIDEVSGQHLAWLLGTGMDGVGNWKYLVLGFILFRVFDIWKPFPARRAERLPGGWGIMADDWVAGIYAAVGLWVARWLGL